MQRDNGSRSQRAMQGNPSLEEERSYYAPTRGVIEGVLLRDAALNTKKQTVLDLYLPYYKVRIVNVPVKTSKMTKDAAGEWHGEEITPNVGDLVLVHFIDGNFRDPIAELGINAVDNNIQGVISDANPMTERRFHRKINGTSEKIEKDGTRRVYVKKDEVLEVEGAENVTVKTGDITISVIQGKATVNIKGKTTWKSEGGIEHDGVGDGQVKGVVQGDCLCSFTGKPHPHISASVKASK